MKKNKRVFIIAEAGVNHNGDLGIAKRMVDAAARAGADAVKFQTFKADDLATVGAPCARYQKGSLQGARSQHAMLQKLELDEGDHIELIGHCKRLGIAFISSPFDMESVEMLARLGLKIIKIPSGEITNLPYLRKIGRLNKKVIMSTGMSELSEITEALKVLINSGTPKGNITVLHCTTEYPAPAEDVNLRAMMTMKDALKVKIGYSDHTLGVEAAIAAVALGASVIEKHFTLDKNMEGPDHRTSVEPAELKQMVESIRRVEKALGSPSKKLYDSEKKNVGLVRKSIVAARPIKKGDILTAANIAAKRSGKGISPMLWDKVIGNAAKKDFEKDEMIAI